jgi:hypothetical protein
MRRGENMPDRTPDGRYIIVRERLWRASNPVLSEDVRRSIVGDLMQTRRLVRSALKSGNADDLRAARAGVQAAKERLGERGPVWWSDGAPDETRKLVKNSSYAEWWDAATAG